MKASKLIVFVIGTLAANFAHSVPDDSAFIAEGLQQGLGDTRPDSPTSITNAIEINAESGNNSATIKLAPITGSSNFSILFSTPLNKDTKDGVFYDTNAFTNSTSVTLNFQRASFQPNLLPQAEHFMSYCEENPTYFGLQDKTDCIKYKIDDLVKKHEEQNKRQDEIVDFWSKKLTEPIFMYGATLTAGTEEYSYLSGIDKQTTTNNPWGAGLNLSYAIPHNMMITAQYEIQQSYKPQKNTISCSTTPNAMGFLNCVNGANGAPSDNKNRIISLEIRKPLSLANVAMAVSPKITHDIKDSATKFTMPIYLFQDSKKNLTGGVSTNWSNADHKWTFGVFVGSSFGLL